MRSKPKTPRQRIRTMTTHTTILEDLDAIDKRLDALIEERKALKTDLRQRPELREIVGELRGILATDGACGITGERLRDLLRRLEEPNQGTT